MSETKQADVLMQVGKIERNIAEMAEMLLKLHATLEGLKIEIKKPLNGHRAKLGIPDPVKSAGTEKSQVRTRHRERKHRFGVLAKRNI